MNRLRSSPRFQLLVLALVLAAMAALASSCSRPAADDVAYHCPMHPTYVSDRPGDCPICGMRLVPIDKKSGSVAHDHPTGGAPAPGLAPSSGRPAAGSPATTYVCPMHPNVVSDKPGKCPECGMDLEPVAAAAGPPGAGAAPAPPEGGAAAGPGVPGMAPVDVGTEGLRLAGIQTAPVTRKPLARTIRTVGTVAADETRVRHVHTKIAGWVEKLWVNFTGQLVRRGDPVLAIYSQELVASQEELLRARDLARRFAASAIPEVRQGADDLVAAARRRLLLFDVPESLLGRLEETWRPERTVTLPAPVSGYVTSKSAFEGQQVEPGMELFTITDLSRVWLEADIYEYEAPFVRLGQPARLSLPYQPDRTLTGRLGYIYPTMNAETRTLRVRYELANPGQALRPGMFANVEIDLSSSEALVVPDSAVLDTGERQVVFLARGGGRFDPREVRTRPAGGGLAEVLAGLGEGDQVVIRANFLLDSESRLRSAIAGSGVAGAAGAPAAHGATHPAPPKKDGPRP